MIIVVIDDINRKKVVSKKVFCRLVQEFSTWPASFPRYNSNSSQLKDCPIQPQMQTYLATYLWVSYGYCVYCENIGKENWPCYNGQRIVFLHLIIKQFTYTFWRIDTVEDSILENWNISTHTFVINDEIPAAANEILKPVLGKIILFWMTWDCIIIFN